VVGDQRFAGFLMRLSPVQRHWAVTCIPAAELFDPEDARHALQLLRRDFPRTYRLYIQHEARTRPNRAVQRTAGRSAFHFRVASNLSQQPRALSPAVADLVSR
jgi:hypothetical protein